MSQEKKIEMLSEAIRVTREEARAALEASDWSVPEAAQLLQRQRRYAERAARPGYERGRTLRGPFGWFAVTIL